jgi:hypothetical protein
VAATSSAAVTAAVEFAAMEAAARVRSAVIAIVPVPGAVLAPPGAHTMPRAVAPDLVARLPAPSAVPVVLEAAPTGDLLGRCRAFAAGDAAEDQRRARGR